MEHINQDRDFIVSPVFSFGKLCAVNLYDMTFGAHGRDFRVEFVSANDQTTYKCMCCKNSESECAHVMGAKIYVPRVFSSHVLASSNNEVIDNHIVTPIEPINWFSSFCVTPMQGGKAVEVDTVDVYTYKCSQCENAFECCHIECVTKFVENRLDDQSLNHKFAEFVNLCTSLGISKEYFDDAPYKHYDPINKISLEEMYKCLYEKISNELAQNGSINEKRMFEIEKEVRESFLHPIFSGYCEEFRLSSVSKLSSYIDEKVLTLSHNCEFNDTEHNVKCKHKNWKLIWTALVLASNLGADKYKNKLDAMFKAKTDLYENIELVTEVADEQKKFKQFYESQLPI